MAASRQIILDFCSFNIYQATLICSGPAIKIFTDVLDYLINIRAFEFKPQTLSFCNRQSKYTMLFLMDRYVNDWRELLSPPRSALAQLELFEI